MVHFDIDDETWYAVMRLGSEDENWHAVMNLGKEDETWYTVINPGGRMNLVMH